MLTYEARVCGRLTAVVERPGEDIVRLGWTDDLGGPCTATLGADRFERHVESGAIVIVDPEGVCHRLRVQAAAIAAVPSDPVNALP
jgi:hypothetical protein